jgi:DNA replication and repair protein RecF
MRLTRLIVRDVRNLESIDWRPVNGLNVLVGPNGGGKTSLLEAIHLAAVGRSFRTRDTSQVIRRGTGCLSVSAWFEHASGQRQHFRMHRDVNGTRISLDDRVLKSASEVARAVPILALSQDGVRRFKLSRGERRSLVDWGLFHVEPAFHAHWARYHTALAQRNAALRRRQPTAPWLEAMVAAGEEVSARRQDYVQRLQESVDGFSSRLGVDFAAGLDMQRGWPDGQTLSDYWAETEHRDRGLGYTSGGPHRANLLVRTEQRLGLEHLSSGQVKLLYLAFRLAQLEDLLRRRPESEPIIFFDDLAAELDSAHLRMVLAALSDHQLQRFVTSPVLHAELTTDGGSVFHVERGTLVQALFRDSHD